MNEVIKEVRPPEIIAAEINRVKRSTAQYVLLQSIEIGRLLCEAKETVPFGDWGTWLEENCAYSQSNANNLMRIYREYGESSQLSFFEENKLELYGDLNRSQAIALLALPSEERAEFVKENDVQAMSVSELEEAIKAAKAEAEEKLRVAENLKNDAIKRANDADDRSSKMLAAQKAAEAERDKAKTAAKTAKDKLTAVEAERDRLQVQIGELENRKPELTPEEKTAIEEAAKAEYQKDIDYLKAQNDKLKAASDPTTQKFAVYFEEMNEKFGKMLALLPLMDDEAKTKFSGALGRALDAMKAKL